PGADLVELGKISDPQPEATDYEGQRCPATAKTTEDQFFYIPGTDRACRPTNACGPAITAGSERSLAASPAGGRWGLCCLQEAQAMADKRMPSHGRSVAAAISGAWPRPEQQIPVSGSRIRAMFTSACEIVAQWHRRVRIRNELMTLSDRDLRDVRWTRAEVEAECRKPFWRA